MIHEKIVQKKAVDTRNRGTPYSIWHKNANGHTLHHGREASDTIDHIVKKIAGKRGRKPASNPTSPYTRHRYTVASSILNVADRDLELVQLLLQVVELL